MNYVKVSVSMCVPIELIEELNVQFLTLSTKNFWHYVHIVTLLYKGTVYAAIFTILH